MKEQPIAMWVGAICAIALSSASYAQNADTKSVELEEILVTATKRAESVQSIPAPIVAVDAGNLAIKGVKDINDITKVLPDVKIDTIIGGTNIAIRGIRTGSVSPTTDSPASLNIDGIYLANTNGLNGLLYDLQRVELLPGPQGTLYGRNATSGVVNFVPNHPTDEAGGSFEMEGGSYAMQRMDGAINMPIGDAVAIRAAGHVYRRDGYFANGTSAADQRGGRLTARVRFTDRLTLLLSTDYEKSQDQGDGFAVVGSTYGAPVQGPPGTPPPALPNSYPVPTNPFQDNRILYPLGLGTQGNSSLLHGEMAQLDADLEWSILTAQYGHRTVQALSDNINLSNYNPSNPTGRGAFPTQVGHVVAPEHSTTDSGEVRLASKASEEIKYIGGLYYFRQSTSSSFCQLGSLSQTAITPTNCAQLQINTPVEGTTSYAAFGDATYTPPALTAAHFNVGVRYTEDKKSGTSATSVLPVPTVIDDLRFHKVTYKGNISFDLSPKNLVYAQYSTGFRAGGIAYGSTPIYKPETINAVEVGSKNRFLNDQLQVNVAAFDYRYKNVLTNLAKLGPLPPPVFFGLTDLTVTNIGAVHYQGGSILLDYALTRSDRLGLNLQFVRGSYDTFVIPVGFIATAPLDLTGTPTGNSGYDLGGLGVTDIAPWSGTFAYDHVFHIDRFGALDAGVATQFSGVTHSAGGGGLPNFPGSIQQKYGTIPAYARLDVSLGYEPQRGAWHVVAYANNVTNRVTYSTVGYEGQNNTSSGLIVANLLPPRTYGLSVGAKF